MFPLWHYFANYNEAEQFTQGFFFFDSAATEMKKENSEYLIQSCTISMFSTTRADENI